MTAPFFQQYDPDYEAWKKKQAEDDAGYEAWLAQHTAPTPPHESFQSATPAPPPTAQPAPPPAATTGLAISVNPRTGERYAGGPQPNSPAELGVTEAAQSFGAGLASFGRLMAEKLGAQRAAAAAANVETTLRSGAAETAATPANPNAGPFAGAERSFFKTAAGVVPYVAAGPLGGVVLGGAESIGDVRADLEQQGVDQESRNNAALAIGAVSGGLWGLVPGAVGGRISKLFADEAGAVSADVVRKLDLVQTAKQAAKSLVGTAAAMSATSAVAQGVTTAGEALAGGAPTSPGDIAEKMGRAAEQGAVTGAGLGGAELAAQALVAPRAAMEQHVAEAQQAAPVTPVAQQAPTPTPPPPPEAKPAPPGTPPPPPPEQPLPPPPSVADVANAKPPEPVPGTPPLPPEPGPETDVEALRNENRRLTNELYTDQMTGLPNGRAHQQHLQRIADEGTTDDHDFVAMDMSGLKARNDLDSHAAGNVQIQDAASALANAADELGVEQRNLYHISGDEFGAIVPKGQGQQLLERARELYGERPIAGTSVKNAIDGVVGSSWPDADRALSEFKRNRPADQQRPAMFKMPDRTPAAETSGTGIVALNPQEVEADPERFQFKSSTDKKTGAGRELQGVEKWNPDLAGVIAVWRDPDDGNTYVVNGHHRLELAQRTGAESINARYLDASDAETARAAGALINMAEGRGTPLDVAKWIRDAGATPEDLKSNGVSLRGDLVRKGVALSRLAPDVFDQAATGKLDEGHAAAIGAVTDNPDRQREVAAIVNGTSKRMSAAEVSELTKQVVAAGSEKVSQETLFGNETLDRGLFVDRARIAAAVKDRMAKDSRVFGYVAKEGRAEELARAGSTHIDVDAAAKLAGESANATELFDRLQTRSGPVADAVTAAARRVANGEDIRRVVSDAYDDIRDRTLAERDRITTGAGEHPPGEGVVERGPAAAEGGEAGPGVQPGPADGGQPAEEGPVADSTDPHQTGMFEAGMGGARRVVTGQGELLGDALPLGRGGQSEMFGPGEAESVREIDRTPEGMSQTIERAKLVLADPREQELAKAGKPSQAYRDATAALNYEGKIGEQELRTRRSDLQGEFEVGMGGGRTVRVVNPTEKVGYGGPEIPRELPEAPGVAAGMRRKITLGTFRDSILRLFAPGFLSDQAKETGIAIRGMRARVERAVAIASEATARYAKVAGAFTKEEAVRFIHAIETGEDLGTGELGKAAAALRDVYAHYTRELQARGILRNAIANYVGRIWAMDPEEVSRAIAGSRSKNPAEGSKSFLKERTHDLFIDGLNAGLTPLTYNPFEVMQIKVREMARVLELHDLMEDRVAAGRGRWVMDMLGKAPPTDPKTGQPWQRIGDGKDPAFVKYGPPTEQIDEAFDAGVREKLNAVIDGLKGLTHERKANVGGRGRWGYAVGPRGNYMATKFGGESFIIEHELGHILDFRYGMWDKVVQPAERESHVITRGKKKGQTIQRPMKQPKEVVAERKTVKAELRALADLRLAPGEAEDIPGRQAYVRDKYEQMANIIHAYIHAPDLMRRVAPTVYGRLETFLESKPELKPIMDIEPTLRLAQGSTEIPVAGLRIMGHYYEPNESAQVWHNALSRGLRGNSIYDAFMAPTNSARQAILGLSGFHLGTTAKNAWLSDIALGLEQLGSLDAGGVKTIGKSVVAPVRLARFGKQVIDEFRQPSGGDLGRLVSELTSVGFAPGARNEIWSGERWSKMQAAARQALHGSTIWQKASGAAKLPLDAVFALNERALRPLFERYIPAVKAAATYELAAHALKQLPEGATIDDRMGALKKVVDQMDARFGLVRYDNYFTHQMVKDLAHALFLAPGWTTGTASLLAETAADVAKAPAAIARGERPAMSHSSAFTLATALGMGAAGGLIHFLYTGQRPKDVKDFYYPGDGTYDANGNMNRQDLRSYLTTDWLPMLSHPVRTAENKLSPVIHLISTLASNRTYYGDYAYDPSASTPEQLKEAGVETAKELGVPLSIRNLEEAASRGEPTGPSAVKNFVGIMPAPRAVVRDKAENLMQSLSQSEGGHAPLTPAMAERERERRDAEQAMRDRNTEKVRAAFRAGTIGMADMRHEMREEMRGVTSFGARFRQLTLEDAERVYAAATPDERRQVATILMTKRLNALRARARGVAP